MRVVQLLPELNEGGVERGVVELNRELVKRGVESIVISAGGKQAAQIDVDGGRHVRFDVVSKNPLTAPLRVLQLQKILKQLQPDILHARSRVPAWLAYLANKNLKIPFVTTVHGFNSVNAYSRVMTYGDRVICVSNAIKDYIQEHYQVPDEKIAVIPRGVDLQLFDPERVDSKFVDELTEKYRLKGRFVVTAIGRITQLKDYETFIRGIVAAREIIPEVCGLIVGGVRQDKQAYFQLLQILVKDLGVEGIVHFVGSQQKIAEIYALSNIVVTCSRKPESFGRTAAEALAMNVPVIATRHGGVVDIVKDGVSGVLIAVEDVAGIVAGIYKYRNLEVGDLRETVVNNFSLQQMVNRTLSLYLDLTCGDITDANFRSKF